MERIHFFANCVCEDCCKGWGQHYDYEDEVACPNCGSDDITFENVEAV